MNIYDISAQAGVSIATVSRVLNGSDKVSQATREKVLKVIEKNGYMPNAFARSLSTNTMSQVGILCSDVSDVYQSQAVYYLERELRDNSFGALLCCTGHNLGEKEEYIKMLLSRNVDAIFFIGSHFIEESEKGNTYIRNTAEKVPVFLLNGELNGKNIYSILCDDKAGSRDISNLIFEKGSRKPLFLYRIRSQSGKRKEEGFREACFEHGIEDLGERVYSCPGPVENTCQILERIKEKGVEFDSVIASDDELAVGTVKYASHNHLKIPEDFQIVGYNNSVLSSCSSPEITTLDNKVEFMCTTAVSQLFQLIHQKMLPQKTIFSGEIIARETTR